MSSAFRDIVRAFLTKLFTAPLPDPRSKVHDGQGQEPLQLDVRGHEAARTSYSPVHGDSHAFLGSAFATHGMSNT